MNSVKNLLSAVLLAAILAVTTFAGDLHNPGFAPTPTPTPEEMSACDDMLPVAYDPNTGSLSTETSDSLFYEALAALLSVY